MDITSKLLEGASPYLSRITYHVVERYLELITVDNPDNMNDKVRIVFPQVIDYSEEINEVDDDLIESVIGFHWMAEDRICVKSDIREIIITLKGEPYAEAIT